MSVYNLIIDAVKKARKVQRIVFTRCLNRFWNMCESDEVSLPEQQVALQLLESRYFELESVHKKYVDIMLESDTSEEEITNEIEYTRSTKTSFLVQN